MLTLFVCTFVAVTAGGAAQAPSGAAAAMTGVWTLDTYLTDRPEQIAAAIRIDLGFGRDSAVDAQSGRMQQNGMRGGDSRRGGGRGQGMRGEAPPNVEEQNKLEEQLSPLRYPATTLTLEVSADKATATDDQGQTRTLRWDGPQLAFDQDLGKGRKVLSTYSIVPTTKQLLIRVRFDRGPGLSSPFEIRYVYNRTSNP